MEDSKSSCYINPQGIFVIFCTKIITITGKLYSKMIGIGYGKSN